jgi:hypothetical protein
MEAREDVVVDEEEGSTEETEEGWGSSETTNWYSSPGTTSTGKVSVSRVEVLYLSDTLTWLNGMSGPVHNSSYL